MIKKLNLFFTFLAAPLLGFYFAFYQTGIANQIDIEKIKLNSTIDTSGINQWNHEISVLQEKVDAAKNSLIRIQNETRQDMKDYKKQQELIVAAAKNSISQTKNSNDALEQVLSNLLGDPIGITKGENATIKVYNLIEAGYRGYMAKVSIHDPDALKMVLANDRVYNTVGETPIEAARRKNAVLAVNAGGYLRRNGQKIPLGVTVVDGEIKTAFFDHGYPFVGFNKEGQFVILNNVESREQIKRLNILQGASFRPILLKDGKKLPINPKFQNQREPRTIIGNYSNGDLLFVVIDGRRAGWSKGITLEEVQNKLLEFKVKNAYNLDGGGSSAFYYDGRILNKPSDGYVNPVTTNLVVIP